MHQEESLPTFEQILSTGKINVNDVQVFKRTDGMGKSVITKRKFKFNEIICTYGGKIMRKQDQANPDFALTIGKDLVVDGDPSLVESQGHVGNYINDAEGPIKCGVNNVIFCIGYIRLDDGTRKRCVWIKAKYAIEAGTELFVSYGRDYWPGYCEKHNLKAL